MQLVLHRVLPCDDTLQKRAGCSGRRWQNDTLDQIKHMVQPSEKDRVEGMTPVIRSLTRENLIDAALREFDAARHIVTSDKSPDVLADPVVVMRKGENEPGKQLR